MADPANPLLTKDDCVPLGLAGDNGTAGFDGVGLEVPLLALFPMVDNGQGYFSCAQMIFFLSFEFVETFLA